MMREMESACVVLAVYAAALAASALSHNTPVGPPALVSLVHGRAAGPGRLDSAGDRFRRDRGHWGVLSGRAPNPL